MSCHKFQADPGHTLAVSAQTTETSTYLYNLFRPPFSSNATSASATADSDSSSNAALAYTVTKFPAEKLYRYLFSPDNAKHLSLSPLSDSDDENIVYAQYVQSARKQLGGGVLGLDIKYAAWRVIWRGVVMDLYVTSVSLLFLSDDSARAATDRSNILYSG